jgi:hypothetical protein
VVVALMAMGSFFFLSQVYEFFVDYSYIYKWETTQGRLINVELTNNKKSAHLTYIYKINNNEFLGDKTGVARHKWYDVNNKKISKLRGIIENLDPINVKYNPKNTADSVYDFDSDDVFIVIFSMLPLATLIILFLLVFITKVIDSKSQI